MGAVIQKGMIARGRIMNFEVELPDTPGQLVKVATLLAEQRANVIQLDHDQFKASGHYTNAVSLGVTVETNGPEHIDRILAALTGSRIPAQAHLLISNTAGGKPRRSVLQYLPLAGGGAKRRWGLTDNHQLLNPPTGAFVMLRATCSPQSSRPPTSAGQRRYPHESSGSQDGHIACDPYS